MDLTELVALVGVVLLVVFAACVGAEMDSETQRRERQRLADERRLRDATRQLGRLRRRGPLCERCPYRNVS